MQLEKNRQLFYSQLEKMFAGRELENFKGKSGFSNLLSIKAKYFQYIKKFLDEDISNKFPTQNLQSELFQKLYTFFDSYLNETGSPFFNKTEFYKNIYERVYTNSQDTALFYKTQRLYYVKSDSIPKEAVFEIKENKEIKVKIIFDTSEIRYTSTNEKKELKFILKSLTKSQKTITLLVVYKSQKVELGDSYSFEIDSQKKDKEIVIKATKENEKKLNELLKKYELKINSSEISKAIHTYKKQQDVDFFIHKDAENFLKEQFDIYLYHYLFKENRDNLWDKERIETIQNIKEIAYLVIEKIGAFEDELKAIWLKPKFVKNLNYIISLDKIDSKCHQEILENEELQAEWRELGLEDKKYQEFLPVDTKHLSKELKEEILSSLDNLDEITAGILIKSDNFQALNTIMPKYKGEIDLIYIDPPFNTGNDFAYKDRFQDSTWLTLMENRLRLSKELLSKRGSFYLHLDEKANYRGRELLNNIFGKENFQNEIIWSYRRWSAPSKKFQAMHDSILYFVSDIEEKIFNEIYVKPANEEKGIKEGYKVDEDGRQFRWQSLHGKRYKIYRDDRGVLAGDVWDISFLHPSSKERIEGALTQKVEKLLERIIKASSNQNSIVMDYFSGSGTTINTAHKLGRRWIGVEMGEYFESVIIPRVKKTLAGVISGISKELEKEGKLKKGGIVKYYELESYEDALFKADYKLNDEGIIDLYNSRKLITKNAIDKKDGIKLNYKDIYENIDIWESISNVSGWKIKHRFKDRCVFDDKGKEIEIKEDELYFSEYPFLRDLIWWKA